MLCLERVVGNNARVANAGDPHGSKLFILSCVRPDFVADTELRKGERRFYLGAVVDDLFLSTPEFLYDGGNNEAPVSSRSSGADLVKLKAAQDNLNAQYSGSEIVTEFAANNAGILEKVILRGWCCLVVTHAPRHR